jgi:cytochrome P450
VAICEHVDWVSPALGAGLLQALMRRVTGDLSLRNVYPRENQRVLIVLASADWYETVFSATDQFQLERLREAPGAWGFILGSPQTAPVRLEAAA